MERLGLRIAFSVLAITFSACLAAQQDTAPLAGEKTLTLDLVATVSAIDPATREVELTDAQGNVRTVTADARVKRFDEIEVGDKVTAQIQVSIVGEVRKPTEEELANLEDVTRGVVRNPDGGPLAGSMSETFTSVATVVALSLLNGTMTVLTHGGNVVDVLAESEDKLKQLRLGDTIVVTYSQSLVVSVAEQ